MFVVVYLDEENLQSKPSFFPLPSVLSSCSPNATDLCETTWMQIVKTSMSLHRARRIASKTSKISNSSQDFGLLDHWKYPWVHGRTTKPEEENETLSSE